MNSEHLVDETLRQSVDGDFWRWRCRNVSVTLQDGRHRSTELLRLSGTCLNIAFFRQDKKFIKIWQPKAGLEQCIVQ